MVDKEINETLDLMSELVTVLNNEDDEDQDVNSVVSYLQVWREVLRLREARAMEAVKGTSDNVVQIYPLSIALPCYFFITPLITLKNDFSAFRS